MASRNSNGEGSLYQRENGTWVYQISTVDENGRQIRKSFTGKSKKMVKDKCKAYLAGREALRQKSAMGLSTHPDSLARQSISLSQWVFDWIQLYKKPPTIKETTYASYMQIWETHISQFFGTTPLVVVSNEDVQIFYNFLLTEGRLDGKKGGLSPKTVRNIHMMLKSALQTAIGKIILKSPCEGTTRPPVLEKEMRVLTAEEMEIFIKEVYTERLKVAIYISLFTGARMGEVLALTWDDVDENKRTLSINKNLVRVTAYDNTGAKNGTHLIVQPPKSAKSKRIIPLQDDVFRLLMLHKSDLEKKKNSQNPNPNPFNLIFPSRVGTYTEPRNYQKRIAAISERCEIQHVNVHALRHTFATRLVEQQVPIRVIQELLGHSSVTTTMRYTHALEDEKEKAVDSMDIWLHPSVKGVSGQ